MLNVQSPSRFHVALAHDSQLADVFQLRTQVFFNEILGNQNAELDHDEYDPYCDHLTVRDGDKIVGVYRLLPWSRLPKYLKSYTDKEFDASPVEAVYGSSILELGRTCVHPEYRNGTVTKLLWQGIAQYLMTHQFGALIGCVSVYGCNHLGALAMRKQLHEQGAWHGDLDIAVRQEYALPFESLYQSEAIISSIPSLMKSYIGLGATMVGGPAYDSDFMCHDFCSLLEMKNLNPQKLKNLLM